MVVDRLENIEKYASLNPLFAQAIEFLKSHDLNALEVGKTELKGKDLLVNVAQTKPKTKEEILNKTTKKEIRDSNHFTWDAIEEVAILFIGIFITMIPALLILKARGADLGLTQPWQFFWITGALSSFLDNTPTYLVFFTTAASLGFTSGVQTLTSFIPKAILMAISCGAVFMGANTYIGNAPNFMVRSIAEENGIKMPSFFGYMFWSLSCLIPVFLIDMLIFFL